MENSGEKIYNALLDLIEISEENQILVKKEYPSYTFLEWLKEFCTIKICTSRRGGHSYAIGQLLRDKFKNDQVVVISLNERLETIVKHQCLANVGKNTNHIFCTINNLHNLRGLKDIKAVVCDCSSVFKEQQIKDIYCMASLILDIDNTSFIIFVQ